ncbi:uncharacterized protein B0T15DRAFT_22221 [Chaetomium strumarium]|uniref:F-box domain-containing protein n=1 Tax=Chaetomium strumarium TaxID=1170767 RepID=A0AAJ0H200_9PEZI|nr:hypothetical protein B0T15DRAFT_22221 [Chaetomium strumarium]
MTDIVELPYDIFLHIILYLPPRTCVRCRAVSRRWRDAFTSEHTSQLLLRWNFPLCRELRLKSAAASSSSSLVALPRNVKAELVEIAEQSYDWAAAFAEVARRYFHLAQAKPRVIEKLQLYVKTRGKDSGVSFWAVAPWTRFLRYNNQTSSYHYPDPVWSYSQEDGVLVYPAAVDTDPAAPSKRREKQFYHILDVSTGQRVPVPFDVHAKHIRRVRLAQGVLIFEWADAKPYQPVNPWGPEIPHRHFATAFDVIRNASGAASCQRWTVEFRSEWKLHSLRFLGWPDGGSDRFFSVHTATHYAVYFWQSKSDRSLYQEDPVEQLAIWDISSPSPYRPSEDPRGNERPIHSSTSASALTTGLWGGQNSPDANTMKTPEAPGPHPEAQRGPSVLSLVAATAGPRVIRRMVGPDLDFYGLRQGAHPRLRSLVLDDRNLYMIEEEHRWAERRHSSLNPPRAHLVRSTAIPVIPAPASDSAPAALFPSVDGPVYGPIWVDTCGANGDVHMNFCQRMGSNSAADSGTARETRPRLPAGHPDATGPEPEQPSNQPRPRPSAAAADRPWIGSTESVPRPGCAPCWRHEEFPYLTVTEMVDFAAGVRVAARHCFMLETLSKHVRPEVSVKVTLPATDQHDDDGSAGSSKTSGKRRPSSARSKEVLFHDDMWSELVGKGHIAGEERWMIGEDYKRRITIVRF